MKKRSKKKWSALIKKNLKVNPGNVIYKDDFGRGKLGKAGHRPNYVY
jgi:hypothetical protein